MCICDACKSLVTVWKFLKHNDQNNSVNLLMHTYMNDAISCHKQLGTYSYRLPIIVIQYHQTCINGLTEMVCLKPIKSSQTNNIASPFDDCLLRSLPHTVAPLCKICKCLQQLPSYIYWRGTSTDQHSWICKIYVVNHCYYCSTQNSLATASKA